MRVDPHCAGKTTTKHSGVAAANSTTRATTAGTARGRETGQVTQDKNIQSKVMHRGRRGGEESPQKTSQEDCETREKIYQGSRPRHHQITTECVCGGSGGEGQDGKWSRWQERCMSHRYMFVHMLEYFCADVGVHTHTHTHTHQMWAECRASGCDSTGW